MTTHRHWRGPTGTLVVATDEQRQRTGAEFVCLVGWEPVTLQEAQLAERDRELAREEGRQAGTIVGKVVRIVVNVWRRVTGG